MSGGERSFTTVSLLLAMWELSPGPIRCLDEWDVFLDAANRGVAAQMLVRLTVTVMMISNILILCSWTGQRLLTVLSISSSPLS